MRRALFILISCFVGVQPLWAQESPSSPSATRTATQALNPNISVIGSLAGAYFNHDPIGDQAENPSRTGFNFQGIELALQSAVDPYVRGDIFIHLDEGAVSVEQAELTTLALPWNLQIKAGKLLGQFGRENGRHLEQLGFVDSSRVDRYFFGNEGFKELGVEASVLLPTAWYSQITGQFLQGENAGNFDGTRKQDFATVGRWVNTADLTQNLTLLSGLSSAIGFNKTAAGNLTEIFGGDLYLRFRPSANRGLKWQTEYFWRQREAVGGKNRDGGLDSQLIWQWAKRWETGVRFDWIGIPGNAYRQRAVASDLTFLATEFFRMRAQCSFVHTESLADGHEIFLQMQFNMGPHGAHVF